MVISIPRMHTESWLTISSWNQGPFCCSWTLSALAWALHAWGDGTRTPQKRPSEVVPFFPGNFFPWRMLAFYLNSFGETSRIFLLTHSQTLLLLPILRPSFEKHYLETDSQCVLPSSCDVFLILSGSASCLSIIFMATIQT